MAAKNPGEHILEKDSITSGSNDTHRRHNHHHVEHSEMAAARHLHDGSSLTPEMWHRKFANPGPLGLCALSLCTFVISLVNVQARGVKAPNIVLPIALAYGGLVQLLAGMWEFASGNTFGATALSSYAGFWISYGILLTPSFAITTPNGVYEGEFENALGLYMVGWFVFTVILMLYTLRSTATLFLLFFFLSLNFLFVACTQFAVVDGKFATALALQKTSGACGFIVAFLGWYEAVTALQDRSNSFFQLPVLHFPWSEHSRNHRGHGQSHA